MATSNVIVTRSGTGFTIDVTACNLLSDLTIKDFFILHNGSPYNVLSNYTKTSQTILTFTGGALGTTTIEVRRKTPPLVIRPVNFGERFSSDLWNKELDRKTRWQEEADLNGVGVAFSGVVPSPRNDPYGVIWDGDTVFPPSRDVLYDKFELMAPLASPALTGNPTAPTQAPSSNNTRLANTAYVDAADALKANLASPALTGTPTAPTPTAGTNNTQLATTAFVATSFAPLASPTFTGNPTAPTPSRADNDTSIATTAHVKSWVTTGTASGQSIDIGNLRVQWGSNVVICDANGDAGITYPVSFVSDPASFITATNGDVGIGTNLIVGLFGTSSNISFAFKVRRSDNTAYVGSFRVNWFAIGRAI